VKDLLHCGLSDGRSRGLGMVVAAAVESEILVGVSRSHVCVGFLVPKPRDLPVLLQLDPKDISSRGLP
jgi:hypothetical protein